MRTTALTFVIGVAMICPACSFQNRKGTLACAKCGAAATRPLNAVIDTRPPAEGPRSSPRLRGELPLDRRSGGLRAFGGGPAATSSPRIRPAPPRWERGARSAPETARVPFPKGNAALSSLSQARTDPQWIKAPDAEVSDRNVTPAPKRARAANDDAMAARPVATLTRRTFAAVIDSVAVVVATAGALVLAFSVFGWHRMAPEFARGVDYVVDGLLLGRGLAPFVFGLMLVMGFAYTTVAHALAGATLGKAMLGMKVVAGDGDVPRPAISAWRSILAGLSFGAAGAGVAVAIADPKHMALHDRIVGTRVLRMAEPREPVEVAED